MCGPLVWCVGANEHQATSFRGEDCETTKPQPFDVSVVVQRETAGHCWLWLDNPRYQGWTIQGATIHWLAGFVTLHLHVS